MIEEIEEFSPELKFRILVQSKILECIEIHVLIRRAYKVVLRLGSKGVGNYIERSWIEPVRRTRRKPGASVGIANYIASLVAASNIGNIGPGVAIKGQAGTQADNASHIPVAERTLD